MTDKEKIEKWIKENVENYCSYCTYACENPGVTGGPNGPVYPPCADWNEVIMMQSLDVDSILQDIEDEQAIEDIFQDN